MLAGNYPGPKYGFKVGFMGSWGFSSTFLFGKVGLNKHWRTEPEIELPSLKRVPYFDLDLTKRIANRNNFQMHLIAGYTYTKVFVRDWAREIWYYDNLSGFNWGAVFGIQGFIFSISETQLLRGYRR